MKIANWNIRLLALSLLFALVDGGANVAEGNCNVGNQAILDDNMEVQTDSNQNCQNSTSAECQAEKRHQRVIYEAPVPARRLDSVGSEMGVAQVIDASRQDQIFDKIAEARYYMNNVVNVEERFDGTRDICKNQNENCAFWAVLGECENK